MFARRKATVGPIAIDLGGATVKLLQLAWTGEQPVVVAWAEVPALAATASTEASAAWMLQLGATLKEQGFCGRTVVTALGPGEFQLKNIRVPPMPHEEIAEAVRFEAEERFGLTGEQAQYRHLVAGQVRQGADIREEVMVFAVPNEVMQKQIEFQKSLGLTALAVDATPCAMARCFVRFLRRAEDATAVNVFLDVGHRATSLVVTRGADVCFVKLIDVGGAAFTEAVAARLGLSDTDARNFRLRIIRGATCRKGDRAGDDLPATLTQSAADAVRPLMEQLAREVQLSLRYFSITFRGQRPECVTFVGGEAHEPSLIPTVAEGLDLPCTIGYPFRGIGGIGALLTADRRSHQPAWAVAMGLALYGSPLVQPHGSQERRVTRTRQPQEAGA